MSTLVEPGAQRRRSVDPRALAPLPGHDGRTELRLARRAMLVLVAVTVPVVSVAAALNGLAGATGALVGAGLVAVLFGGGGLAQAAAVRRGNGAVGVLLAGLGLRLMIYLAALQLVGQIPSLHRPSLALATAIAFVVTLCQELRVIAATPELFWVDAGVRSDERASARPTR